MKGGFSLNLLKASILIHDSSMALRKAMSVSAGHLVHFFGPE